MQVLDKLIADLKWVLTSPSLVNHAAMVAFRTPETEIYTFTSEEVDLILARTSQHEGRLVRWLETRQRYRLGKYFEDLTEWALHMGDVNWHVDRGVQINVDGLTQGELDFVTRSLSRTIHIEAAIKFFIYDPKDTGMGAFWGAQRKDRLDIKLKKICDQQLRLSVPSEYCAPIASEVETRILLKGMLFYPWEMFKNRDFPFIPGLSTNHLRGWWLYEDAYAVASGADIKWLRLERLEWMSPVYVLDLGRITDVPALDDDHRIFIRVRVIGSVCQEVDRGFILRRT